MHQPFPNVMCDGCPQIMAERAKRADKFWAEIDFVGANVAMALIADFMLTWIPAPTLSFA